MGVFDGLIQIPLAVPDPMTDWALPSPGALSYGAITADSALAGTNGHDTLLLAGNRDRQMNGNESTRITENRSHDVGGNQHKQVTGNKDENIIGNFVHQTTGNLHRSIVGMTNDLFTGAHTIAHKANQLLHEPVNFMHNVMNTSNVGQVYAQRYGDYQSLVGVYENVVGLNIDIKGSQLGLIGAGFDKTVIHASEKDVKMEGIQLQIREETVRATVGAVQGNLGAAMFHEVAFTQKIVVVGANQIV